MTKQCGLGGSLILRAFRSGNNVELTIRDVVANQDLVRPHVNLEKIKNMVDLFEEILDV